jgi:hypothetical protein
VGGGRHETVRTEPAGVPARPGLRPAQPEPARSGATVRAATTTAAAMAR